MTLPNPPMDYELFKETTLLTNFDKIPINEYWEMIYSYYTEEELETEELKRKKFVLKPFSSNYCPYNCIFCSSTHYQSFAAGTHAKIIALKPADMEIYLRNLLRYRPETRTILFKDDNFFDRGAIDSTEMLEKLIELRKDYPHLSFSTKARIDTFTKHRELIPLLKKANFFFISLGVESFTKSELEYMNKKVSPEDNLVVLRKMNEAGMKSIIYILLSTPITKIEDIFLTVDSCLEFIRKGDVVKVFPYMIPIKGSTIGNDDSIREFKVYEEKAIPLMDKKVKIAIKIIPQDKKIAELLEEFEIRIPQLEEKYTIDLCISHFTAEIKSLVVFLALYQIAKEKNFLDQDRCDNMIDEIKELIG